MFLDECRLYGIKDINNLIKPVITVKINGELCKYHANEVRNVDFISRKRRKKTIVVLYPSFLSFKG